MHKPTCTAIGAAALAITAGVVILALNDWDGNRVRPKGSELPGPLRTATEKDPAVRGEIAAKGLSFVDSRGIKTYLSRSYREDSPLVEITFKMRDEQGNVVPLRLQSIYVQSDSSGGSYSVKGTGLRLEIADEKGESENLLYGREYTAGGHFRDVNDPPGLVKRKTSEVKFTTPDTLGPGEIYRVELLLIDEIVEKRLAMEHAAEAKRKTEIEHNETITVRITQRSGFASEGEFIGIYHDGTQDQEFSESRSKGVLLLKAPKKLGGEMLVSLASINDLGATVRTFAYIRNVQKRELKLPDDADLAVRDEDLIHVQLVFRPEDIDRLRQFRAVAFYLSEAARYPLFHGTLKDNIASAGQFAQVKVAARVVPGVYYVRAMNEGSSTGPLLGKLTIDKQAGKTYVLSLPANE